MRIAPLALASLLLGAPAASAADFPVTLADGATWTQTSVHTRTDVRNGASQSRSATMVLRATYQAGKTATVRLDFVSFDVEGAGAEEMAKVLPQAKLVYPAVLEVDEALTPTKVREWPKMRETILQALGAAGLDATARGVAEQGFPKDAERAAGLFREQGLVSLGQGTGLELGEPRSYDSEVPNLLGGPPIAASGVFRLESHDTDRGRAVVTWEQKPDPQSLAVSLKASIDGLVARAAPDQAPALKAQLANMTLEREEQCRYEVDTASGLALTTDCTVAIKSGVPGQIATRSDRWVINQTLPEPR